MALRLPCCCSRGAVRVARVGAGRLRGPVASSLVPGAVSPGRRPVLSVLCWWFGSSWASGAVSWRSLLRSQHPMGWRVSVCRWERGGSGGDRATQLGEPQAIPSILSVCPAPSSFLALPPTYVLRPGTPSAMRPVDPAAQSPRTLSCVPLLWGLPGPLPGLRPGIRGRGQGGRRPRDGLSLGIIVRMSVFPVASCQCREDSLLISGFGLSLGSTWPGDTILTAAAPAPCGCCPRSVGSELLREREQHWETRREKAAVALGTQHRARRNNHL